MANGKFQSTKKGKAPSVMPSKSAGGKGGKSGAMVKGGAGKKGKC